MIPGDVRVKVSVWLKNNPSDTFCPYQQAVTGNYALVRELQEVMTQPYAEQSKDVEDKYYRLKPSEFSELGGVSHLSCSS